MLSSSTTLVLVTITLVLLAQVASQNRAPYVLQTGGQTLLQSTANKLNKELGKDLHPREWGRKLGHLKKKFFLGNDHRGKIWSNGDFSDLDNNVIDNLLKYRHN